MESLDEFWHLCFRDSLLQEAVAEDSYTALAQDASHLLADFCLIGSMKQSVVAQDYIKASILKAAQVIEVQAHGRELALRNAV